jgi:hypothetical protein
MVTKGESRKEKKGRNSIFSLSQEAQWAILLPGTDYASRPSR